MKTQPSCLRSSTNPKVRLSPGGFASGPYHPDPFWAWPGHRASPTLLTSRAMRHDVLKHKNHPSSQPQIRHAFQVQSLDLLSAWSLVTFQLLIYIFKRLLAFWHLPLGWVFWLKLNAIDLISDGIFEIIRIHPRGLSAGFSWTPTATTGLSGHTQHIWTLAGSWQWQGKVGGAGGRRGGTLEGSAAGWHGKVCLPRRGVFLDLTPFADSNKCFPFVAFQLDRVTWSNWVSVTASRGD